MRVRAPNLTPGPGSAVAAYKDVDWVRTIRHGVKPNGRPAIIMPSEDYARLTDADMGALVAYVRQLPAAPGAGTELKLPLPVMALYGLGMIQDAAAKIDHTLPPPAPVPEAATAEHGAYVVQSCIGCHGPTLAGGRIPGGPPDWPPAADLTPRADGPMARYGDAQSFAAMLRSGRRPDGSAVSPVMPFASLKELSEVDVNAVYAYLKTLPPGTAR
jgi:mono/diheme cytochrome c family protein